MTRDEWVRAHPWLGAVAGFHAQVEAALPAIGGGAALPDWEDYAADYLDGVPLLHSDGAAVDLEPLETLVPSLVSNLAGRPLPGTLEQELRALDAELRSKTGGPHASSTPPLASLGLGTPGAIADCLLGDSSAVTSSPGLLRRLAWTVAARWLAPVVRAFRGWRDEERWLRNHCPTCGAAPAMAQLVGMDPERLRLLVCGCCETRWRYRRTSCAFCEADTDRLAVITIEGEKRLRIEHCESCRAYLKAYAGEGAERVFLVDWTSLHLDVLALERGLKRLGGSLYELPAALVKS